MSETKVDLSQYRNDYSLRHKAVRLVWSIVWPLATWFLPRSLGRGWKNLLLRMFGARLHPTANVYSSARIYYPANLTMGEHTCLADGVRCYNAAPVVLHANVTVSQEAMLCTASHDISDSHHQLITAPIVLCDQSWVGARAFIGMGVTIGQGAVVGATASVFKDVDPWTVVGGNPARVISQREITH